MTRCPGRDELLQFLNGQLAPAAEEALLTHLDDCGACAQTLDALTGASEPLAAEAGAGLSADFLQRLLAEPEPTATAIAARRPGPLPPQVGAEPRRWGAYELVGLLGRGGMSVVYKARQTGLKRWLALKVITAAGDPAGRERFRREAEAVAALQHPHIVQVHEVGEFDGLPYLALEYVDGGTLAEFLAGTPQEAPAAAALVETLARAMHYAHARGILHRDLKPANILLQEERTTNNTNKTNQEEERGKKQAAAAPGAASSSPSSIRAIRSIRGFTPKITDFGLAKLTADSAGPTRSGEVVGTPSYMAPEQARGEVQLGPATDVYALGAVLYELLTGRPPFKAPLPLVTLDLVLHRDPPTPSSLVPRIPRDLQTICLKCLHKEPARRYPTALELADDLRRFLGREPIRARPVGRLERAWKWARRRPAEAALGAAVVAVTLLGVGGIVWQWRTAVAARDDAQWQAYRANLAAAASDLDLFNAPACRHHLDLVPAALRDTWEWRHFDNRLRGPRHALLGHTAAVRGVCFSPDGKRLLSFADDGTLCLWDRDTGHALATLGGHGAPEVGLAVFTPDGQHVVSAADGTRLAAVTPGGVRLWDVATGRELATLAGGAPDMRLAYSPDGAWVAGGLHDTVRLWDARTGAPAGTLRVPGGAEVMSLAFSPDGTRLAVGADYPQAGVHVFDLRAGALLFSGRGHRNRVLRLAFSPDGTRLASASMDESVRLWDAATGRLLRVLPGHRGAATSVDFSPDGTRLLSAANDGGLRLWDPATGELAAALLGHTDEVTDARYSPDGRWIASASADRSVLLWDAARMERAGGLRGHTDFVYDVAVRGDGGRIASAAWDGTVRLWDGATGEPQGILRAGDHYLLSVAFSPDRRRVAAGSRDSRVWVWDADSSAGPLKWQLPGRGVESLSFRPDGQRLAVALGNFTAGKPDSPDVLLLDAVTGAEVAVLRGHDDNPLAVRYAPDGRRLASAGYDGTVRLWDAESTALLATLRGHAGPVRAVAWGAGGTRLASGGDDRTVRLWDAATGAPLGLLQHASTVYAVAFSPDGRRLATGCADDTIRLWDLATREEVAELRGHQAYVHALAFSPDGTRLVSGSGDRTVRIWDTRPLAQGLE